MSLMMSLRIIANAPQFSHLGFHGGKGKYVNINVKSGLNKNQT